MTARHSERLPGAQHMRSTRDFAAVKAGGTAFRGHQCLLVALAVPGQPTRVGFIASRKGVGGAVQRNRARRRIREIVRRRWPRVPHEGYLLMFVAHRNTLTAPHQTLATEVEHLLASAGALRPLDEEGLPGA